MKGIIILDKVVDVRWNNMTKNFYIKKGYQYTSDGDFFKCRVEDLHANSTVKVMVCCPSCNENRYVQHRSISRNGHTKCNKCARKKNYTCSYCGEEGVLRMFEGVRYCSSHHNQISKYGKCFNNNFIYENTIVEKNSYAEIILTNRAGNEVARAIIDKEDVVRVKSFKWRLSSKGYVKTGVKIQTYLHRFIMRCPDNMEVDHIEHNPLDNRKTKLKICTHQENCSNRRNNL